MEEETKPIGEIDSTHILVYISDKSLPIPVPATTVRENQTINPPKRASVDIREPLPEIHP